MRNDTKNKTHNNDFLQARQKNGQQNKKMELRNEIKPLTEKKVYKRVRTEEQRQQNRNWQLRKDRGRGEKKGTSMQGWEREKESG